MSSLSHVSRVTWESTGIKVQANIYFCRYKIIREPKWYSGGYGSSEIDIGFHFIAFNGVLETILFDLYYNFVTHL